MNASSNSGLVDAIFALLARTNNITKEFSSKENASKKSLKSFFEKRILFEFQFCWWNSKLSFWREFSPEFEDLKFTKLEKL